MLRDVSRDHRQLLTRHWIEFDTSTEEVRTELARYGALLGCGVTAYSYEEALLLVQQMVFRRGQIPALVRAVENVDIRSLDRGHVVPNMLPPIWRGVWWPPYGEP